MPIWERKKGESSKVYQYFCYYRDIGLLRTLKKVSTKFVKSTTIMQRYSSKYKWLERSKAYDDHKDEILRKEQEQEIKRFAKEQVALGTELMDKGQSAIKVLTDDLISPSESTRLISLGNDLKKQGFGIPDRITEQKGSLDLNISGELTVKDLTDAYGRIKGNNAGNTSE